MKARSRLFSTFAGMLVVGFSMPAATAVVVVEPGFSVQAFGLGFEADGLAPGPGGSFGSELFVATNGAVVRMDPETGTVTPFASGLATGGSRPSGLAFDNGGFGTGNLYVSQNNGSVLEIDATGSNSTLASGGTLFSSNDLAFAPVAGGFGNDLFVTNGPFGFGNVSRVSLGGVDSVFVGDAALAEVPVGIAFSGAGSAFGESMFLSLANGNIVKVDAAGTPSEFAGGLGLAIDLAVSAGGAFGEHLYVSDPNTQSILRVDPAGAVSTFATGFNFASSGFDADVVFGLDGDTLFAATSTGVVAITATESPGVAEPETWAIFVAGICLLAIIVRRQPSGSRR